MSRVNPLNPVMYAPDQHAPVEASPDQGRPPERHEVVNVALISWTVVFWVLFSPAAYFWHRFQVQGNANTFLAQAQTAETKKEFRDAAVFIDRYLALRPDDVQQRIRLADVYAKSTTGPEGDARAVALYKRAMLAAPKDLELRKRQAELQLKLAPLDPNRYPIVVSDAEAILKAHLHDPGGHRLKALALWGLAQNGKKVSLEVVRQNLQEAIKHLPGDIQLSVELANLYRNEFPGIRKAAREALGRKVLDDLIENNPSNPEAYLARFRYRVKDNVPDADDDLTRALEIDPKHMDALLTAGGRAANLDDLEAARGYFERAMEAKPADARPYLGLAETYAERGAYEKAIDVWKRGLTSVPVTDAAYATIHLRLAEGYLAANRLDELEAVCKELDAELKRFHAMAPPLLRLRMEARLLFFRGRIEMAEGRAFEAVKLLRRSVLSQQVVTENDHDRRQRLQSAYYLGVCYSLLKQWDLAAAAFEEASRYDPTTSKYVLAAADAWERAAKFDLASKAYEQALAQRGTSPEVWVSLARVRFTEQTQLPRDRRDWQPFRDALKTARRAAPDATSLRVLEADFAAIMGQRSDALAQLKRAYAEDPESESLGRAMVLTYEQVGEHESADAALADYVSKHGDGINAKKIRVTLHMQRGEVEKARTLLEQTLPEAKDDDRALLTYQLAQVEMRAGRLDEARKHLDGLASENPSNVPLLEQVIRLALDARDFAAVEHWEERLRSLEGVSGTLSRYYQAERLLAQAVDERDPKFEEARRLQREIVALRPNWPSAFLLSAEMAERSNDSKQAIDLYAQAIDLGESRVSCYERLIHLLYNDSRYAEAEEFLTRLRDHVLGSAEMSDLAIPLLAEQGHVGRAIDVAQKAAARRTTDPQGLIWLGQSLQLAGRNAEAEATFRQACEEMPREAQSWIALLGFYARIHRMEEARQTLEALGRYADLSSDRRLFVLAQGFEMVGDRTAAEAHYREAIAQTPDQIDLLRRAAEFFIGLDDALAEDCLQRLLVLEPNSEEARRRLIVMLRNRGSESDWRKVAELLERADAKQDVQAEDLRLQAQLLIQRGGKENIDKAIALMEDLIRAHESASPDDFLALARLLEGQGRPTRARELMMSLASSPNARPRDLAAFVDLLLRNDFFEDAASWLDQLERLDPNSFDTLALRVRLMSQGGRGDEIESRVEEFVARQAPVQNTPRERAVIAARVGRLYQDANQLELAEKWYRRAYELSPLAFSSLATWLAAQRRADEAVDLCVAAAPNVPILQVGLTLSTVLSWCTATRESIDKSEPFLAQALDQHTRDANLLLQIGRLRFMQDRPEESVSLMRRVLELEPQNVEAMRVLALLLSEQPTHQGEAMQIIRRAMATAGERDDLRDALGMVLLNQGRQEEAINVLRDVALKANPMPQHAFHLALAYQQAGNRPQARRAIRQAQDAQLDPLTLPVNERTRLEQLEASLRVNPS